MQPELVTVLEAIERRGDYVVLTQYHKPFSAKALGMRMQDWTMRAGHPAGLHVTRLEKNAWQDACGKRRYNAGDHEHLGSRQHCPCRALHARS
jgi:hypothetical protein